MGTIAEKLSYLNDTKDLFKDRLNSLGAEITSSTTFRNYLNWLDAFYGEVSNKTDLSQNGVVGRTSQNSTTGKNLFNKLDYTQITTNGNGSPTNIVKQNDYISFASSGSVNFSGLYIPNNSVTNYIDNFNTSTNYYISFDVTVDKACKFGGGQTTTYIDIPIGKTRVSFYGTITGSINFYVRNAITDGVNVKIENIMVSTESDTTYEPYTYGASPNPDYPQPINNLSGDVPYKVSGKNKFDIDTITNFYQALATYSNGLVTTISLTEPTTSNIIPNFSSINLSSGTYYMSMEIRLKSGRGSFSKINDGSVNWEEITKPTLSNTFQKYVYRHTYDNAKTLSVMLIQFSNSTNAVYEIKNIMISTSSDTTYQPYIEPQTFDIPLGDIELCKISTYQDRIYSDDGKIYLEKNNGKVVLDGSEGWSKRTDIPNLTNTSCFRTGLGTLDSTFVANTIQLSNMFECLNNTSDVEHIRYTGGSNYRIQMFINKSRLTSDDTTGLQAWLNTNKPIIYYILATPTTTEITQENYPSLYNALKQIQDYLTAYKINKEFILGYDSPEIEY